MLRNRNVLIALAILVVTSAVAGDTATGKYLVATRSRTMPELATSFAKSRAPVTIFRSVNGFAATLTDAEASRLRNDPEVLYVEPDPPRFLFERESRVQRKAIESSVFVASSSTQQVPYGVALVNAPALWTLTRGANVRVGIADTGIDLTHSDLAPNIDGGRSFLPGITSFQDEGSHGTHVAGTVGGVDNDFGVVGVAPEAKLYSLRVFKGQGTNNDDFANASAVIEVIDWAIENGVTILNMSFGGPESSLLEAEALARARDSDLIVAVATGNTGTAVPQFPAAYPEAFGVGSVDANSQIAGSSTRGSFVDVVAPGVGVKSTVPERDARSMIVVDSVIGSFEGSLLALSPRGALEGEWVACGLGRPTDFPPSVAGRIALIERGALLFADKAKNAKAAGATAVVIYNNEPGLFSGTLADDGFDYPLTVGISQESGQALIGAGSSTFESSIFQAYGVNSGTSMATPHVAGAAALLRALVPSASARDIEDALTSTARDLGEPGYDIVYGHGLIDVEAAARKLAPERFSTRQRPVRR